MLLSKSNLLPEILVKTLKINGVILRIHVSDIAFRININCWVVAFIREKRRDAGGGTRCIIESEFGERKEFVPIVLLIPAIHPHILFHSLVRPFGLTVGFQMMSGGEMKFHG